MFIEPTRRREPPHLRTGWIEIICGSMFSGKTEELIRRLTRARIARLSVRIFKPALDTRYHEENIVSHSALTIHSKPVQTAAQILSLADGCDVVGID
ncbi:MAG: thymidine kinase, partial [Alphaproteobacteria bacterium]